MHASNAVDVSGCPACGFASPSRVLLGFDLNYLTSRHCNSVYVCPSCGIGYTLPRLDPNELADAYPRNYHVWGDSLRWLGTHRRALLRMTAWLSGALSYAELFYPDVIDPRCFGRPGRILEVGCGSGASLAVMQAAGWTALGIEPNPIAVKHARERGVVVSHASLETCKLPSGYYDVITLHHVLEHVVDLNRSLDLLRDALAPRGRIYIAVPNFGSGPCQFFGPSWALLDLPRHRFHFTPASLRHLLAKHGLRVVDEHHIPSLESVVQSIANLYLNRALERNVRYHQAMAANRLRHVLSNGLGSILSFVFGRFLSIVAPNRGSAFAIVAERDQKSESGKHGEPAPY